MEDVWRKFNPKVNDHTFYSTRHNTFSRIDMIWTTKETVLMTKVEIMPKINSDHNPVTWRGVMGQKKYIWRLNEDLLKHQAIVDFVQEETNSFFQLNINKDVQIPMV